jgi:ferredoxin
VIVGAKACDLKALEVYDKVFLEGEVLDPFYSERRERTVLISADCPNPEDSCFCNLVGIAPYPTSGFDLNLSVVDNGCLIEVGSEKGAALVKRVRTIFQPASSEQLKQRDEGRAKSVQKLKQINPEEFSAELPKKIMGRSDGEFWSKESTTCVECCACLHICPTCYCFLLYDQPSDGESERMRVWDTCYYAAYARVGGGANPRSDFSQRFKNRFLCKYSYFPGYHGVFACSGCGRCISGCTAKIDIREVLWRV